MRINLIKKCLACLLAAVLVLAVFPLEMLAAVPAQLRPIPRDGAGISSADGAGAAGNQYHLHITWRQPTAGLDSMTRPVGATDLQWPPEYRGVIWTRYASQYLFTFTNRATGAFTFDLINSTELAAQGVALQPGTNEILPGTLMTWNTNNLRGPRTFAPGSMYEIEITPQRFDPVWQPDPPTTPPSPPSGQWERATAPITQPLFSQLGVPEMLPMVFMSDILVEASGTGSEITVEWTSPVWRNGGVEFEFPRWIITVRDSGTGHAVGTRSFDLDETSRLPGNWRSVVLDDLPLVVGNSYWVSVDPAHETGILVRAPGQSVIELPGADGNMAEHRIAFRTADNQVYQSRDPVMVMPTLNMIVDGDNHVRLYWGAMSAAAVGRVVVEQWTVPVGGMPTILAELPAPHYATGITTWNVGRIMPEVPTAFSIFIYCRDNNPLARSNFVYFYPEIAHFLPYTPVLEPIEADLINGVGHMDLVWQAFTRAAYTDDERVLAVAQQTQFPNMRWPVGHELIDMNLRYRIFISNAWENVNWGHAHSPLFPPTVQPEITPSAGMILDPTMPRFFRSGINQYTGQNADGTWSVRPLRPNGVYFVRIEAIRDHPGGLEEYAFISAPSFGVVYIPPDDDLLLRPEMIDAPPLSASVNEPGETPQINLIWDLRYIEIGDIHSAPDNRWYASAGVDIRGGTGNETLIFGRAAQFIDERYVRGWNALNNMLYVGRRAQLRNREVYPLRDVGERTIFLAAAMGDIEDNLGITLAGTYPLRIQDMYRRHYRIHVVTHADLMAAAPPGSDLATAFEQYRDALMLNNNAWQYIGRPVPSDGVSTHEITDFPGLGALRPNTAYVVFLQPIEPALPGEPGLAFFPNYVVVTTPDVFVPAVPIPTTPVLFPGQAPTDTSVSVRWRVQGEQPNDLGERPPVPRSMFFELRWSESILEYPTGGGSTVVTWDELYEGWGADFTYWQHPVTRQWYYHFTMRNLFPDTMHYVWARAFNIEGVSSGWSNPIELRTRDITPPPPPRMGLASRVHLHAYNLANDTAYEPIESNAFTLVISRIFSDFRTHELPRAEDGEAVGGSAALVDLPHLPEVYAVRFYELIANRHYYARARTFLTVSREGTPNRVYSYEIEVADNPDFLDAITFTIPPLEELDALNMRRAVSDWATIELSTAPSYDDFDGVFRPEQFPLPDYDWEITYVDGALLWRFRTDRIGADGRPDQQVDQRFISRLINSGVHRYEIDMISYYRRPDWPVRDRELEIPLSILRTFDERRITLAVHFGDVTVEVPPGAFDTAAVRALGMGSGSYIRIGMHTDETAAGLPTLPLNNRFASLPQRMAVTAVTPQRNVTLTQFAQPVSVTLHLDGIVEPGGLVRTGLFYATPQRGAWQDTAGMRVNVRVPATFAGISRETPHTMPTVPEHDPSRAAMERVTARLTFTDLFEYNPEAPVSATAFNNVMNALATNTAAVPLNAPLPAAAAQRLYRARFLAPPDLTFEAAADILVRFYELRTRQIITPMTTPQMIIGIDDANLALHQSLLKAADIGFITGLIIPQAALTMGDFMVMLDIVIRDINF